MSVLGKSTTGLTEALHFQKSVLPFARRVNISKLCNPFVTHTPKMGQ